MAVTQEEYERNFLQLRTHLQPVSDVEGADSPTEDDLNELQQQDAATEQLREKNGRKDEYGILKEKLADLNKINSLPLQLTRHKRNSISSAFNGRRSEAGEHADERKSIAA